MRRRLWCHCRAFSYCRPCVAGATLSPKRWSCNHWFGEGGREMVFAKFLGGGSLLRLMLMLLLWVAGGLSGIALPSWPLPQYPAQIGTGRQHHSTSWQVSSDQRVWLYCCNCYLYWAAYRLHGWNVRLHCRFCWGSQGKNRLSIIVPSWWIGRRLMPCLHLDLEDGLCSQLIDSTLHREHKQNRKEPEQ